MTLQDYLSQNPKKHLIFDFDETIIYLHIPWDIWGEGISEIGNKYDPELVKNFPGWYDLLSNELIKKYGDQAKKEILDFWIDFERKHLKSYDKNQELINFIKENKAKYTFSLWTSNCLPTIEKILGELELFGIFENIVTREKVTLIKPEADGFKLIYNHEKFNKEDYLMIGDSNNDEGAAKAAGIDFFRINYFSK